MSPDRSDTLLAHWKLESDGRDNSGRAHHAQLHQVQFNGKSAIFDGRSSCIEISDKADLSLGRRAFSLSMWIRTDRDLGGMIGDLASKFDHDSRRGFHLALVDHPGVTTSQGNYRHLQFGTDSGTKPTWRDLGRPGQAVMVFGLAAHEGFLYAATYEHGEGQRGHVYRMVDGKWQNCEIPCKSNSVASLAGMGGRLYAATGCYDARGSSIGSTGNTNPEAHVWCLEHSGAWTDCGTPCEELDLYFLGICRGRLYAAPNYHAGLYRYEGGQRWTSCARPYPRFFALAQWRRQLYGAANRSLRHLGPPPGYERIFTPLDDADGVYRYDPDANAWHGCGPVEQETQMYSFAVHRGALHVGTWPNGKVFRSKTGEGWEDCGRLVEEEKEVMAMAVYNGMLYAGTLPAADVYRFDGGKQWSRVGSTDTTPDVKYRRAWSMAVHNGRLFVGTLPSGHVFEMNAGSSVGWSYEWPAGWHHLVAVRSPDRLELFVDGKLFAEAPHAARDLDLSNQRPLLLGAGPHDCFQGHMADVRLYGGALTAGDVHELHREFTPGGD